MPQIGSTVKYAYIVCHNEDISKLEGALKTEGLDVKVNRQIPNDSVDVSSSIKCLQNHLSIWKKVANADFNVIVVESDFVPVVGFSKLATPFPPEKKNESFAYLYACGIEVYDLLDGGYLRGHSGSTVAYFLNPKAAKILIEYANTIINDDTLNNYSTWDTRLRQFLQARGVNSFVPFRNFGEHGGMPNSEHANKGLEGTHRADRLAARLHFLPLYAQNSSFSFFRIRAKAWTWGVGRLVLGRMTTKESILRQQFRFSFIKKLAHRLTF